MDTLRDKVIKLAHANPELRVHLLPIIKEAKAGKKLKGKKLDKHINSTYSRLGNRIMINMMDIPKIWDASKAAYESGGTAEEADAAMEKAIAAAKTKNMPVGSGMPADPAFASKQAARGIQWMQVGVDLSYLASSVDATMKSLGEALRDA